MQRDPKQLTNGPLTGVRILELAHWWAAPRASMILASLGADVVRVESTRHVDPMRFLNQTSAGPLPPGQLAWERAVAYNDINAGKRGITLDLSRPEGLALCRRLIAASDVVTEAFRPAVLGNLGLDYEAMRRIKSDIILVSFPAFGTFGPWSQFVGYGMNVMQLSGHFAAGGYPGEIKAPLGLNPDDVVGTFGALAILTALHYRDQTGEGQWVDVAQTEVEASPFGPFVINASVNLDKEWHRPGNRHPVLAPQGVYPCVGDDNWIAISVRDDADWQRLMTALGTPPWGKDKRFATVLDRHRNHEELDALLSGYTATWDRFELVAQLRAAGVPSGVVQRPSEILTSEPFILKDFIYQLDHEVVGTHLHTGSPLSFQATPGGLRRAAPRLGEHNREILMDELGLDEDEFRELETQRIIGDTPDFRTVLGDTALVGAKDEEK